MNLLKLLLCFCVFITSSYAYLLNGNAIPSNYKIALQLEQYFEEMREFNGTAEITLRLQNASREIEIHKDSYMKIFDIIIIDGNKTISGLQKSYDKNSEKLTIAFGEDLKAGTDLKLRFGNFIGHLYDDMHGFYLSTFENNGQTEYIATTQFQSTFARRAFPCFDEPDYKATFDIELYYPKEYHALGNNIDLDTTLDDGYSKFKTTPKMSTYLVAFVVSKFLRKNSTDVNQGIYARSNAINTAEYAAHVTPEILQVLDNFTTFPYFTDLSMEQLNQIAIPDFSAGAMENWGLVTYRETALLWDKDQSTTTNKQRVASVITHEYTHQWFGNWVTLKWWADTWLNEGHATYFEYHALDNVTSKSNDSSDDWQLRWQFVISELQTIFPADSSKSSMALSGPADSNSEVSAKFDSISYSKGGAVIRMIEHMVGSDKFRNSLINYLNASKFENTEPDDYFKHFSYPDVNFTDFMKNWIYEPGFPIVTVKVQGMKVELTQKQYLYDESENNTVKWNIPISYSLGPNHTFDVTSPKLLFHAGQESTHFNMSNEGQYPILNVQQVGYYRVNYDTTTWGKIQTALKSENFGSIHDLNRAQIVDDIMNLARIGEISYKIALDVTSYLEKDVSYYPWYAAFNAFSFLFKRLDSGNLENSIKNHVLKLMKTLYNETSFAPDNFKHVQSLRNSLALEWACELGHQECLNTATKMFNEYKNNTAATQSPIIPDLRSTVYCAGVAQSEEHWDFLWTKYTETSLQTEQVTILTALGCTNNVTILNNYLMLSLNNTAIRKQDAYSAFSAVLTGTPEGVQVAFDFLMNHYNEISESYGSMNSLIKVINSVADRLTTKEQVDEFEQFIIDNRAQLQEAATVADAALITARANLLWVSKYESDLNNYFSPTPTTDDATIAKPLLLSVLTSLVLTFKYFY